MSSPQLDAPLTLTRASEPLPEPAGRQRQRAFLASRMSTSGPARAMKRGSPDLLAAPTVWPGRATGVALPVRVSTR